ncbi:MAG TPA: ABC transporter ATP-binding protein [Symbiobacteriaceae bacterium]|jgi:ABC-2 type transport system ATP-binding protein
MITIENLSKRYAAGEAETRGTWIASHGLGLWLRNLRRTMTAQPQREVQALDGVNLQVRQGEIFGLLGRNGAGKTTLIKILAGLIRPTGGTAVVGGVSLTRPDEVKQVVSYVSTTGWMGLEWQLSVRENLLFYARLFGLSPAEGTARADRALGEAGLTEHAGKQVQQLSHGMRQRLVLARGLLVCTPLVYLDEPTVGLDPVTAADIRRLIRETINRQRGQTVLLTGHYMPELEELCDRIAIIHQGRVLAMGTVAELKQKVADRDVTTLRVAEWQEAARSELAVLPGVLGVSVAVQDPAAGTALVRVHRHRPAPGLQDILDALRRLGVRVTFASEEAPTLEDAFLHLTGGELR